MKKKNLFGDGLFFPSVFCLIETKQESVDKTPADEQSVWLGASSPFIHLLIYLFLLETSCNSFIYRTITKKKKKFPA